MIFDNHNYPAPQLYSSPKINNVVIELHEYLSNHYASSFVRISKVINPSVLLFVLNQHSVRFICWDDFGGYVGATPSNSDGRNLSSMIGIEIIHLKIMIKIFAFWGITNKFKWLRCPKKVLSNVYAKQLKCILFQSNLYK